MASVASLVSPKDRLVDFTFTIQTILKPLINDKVKEVLLTDVKNSSEWYTMIYKYLK